MRQTSTNVEPIDPDPRNTVQVTAQRAGEAHLETNKLVAIPPTIIVAASFGMTSEKFAEEVRNESLPRVTCRLGSRRSLVQIQSSREEVLERIGGDSRYPRTVSKVSMVTER
jgi:hypothetical protein